MMNINMPKSRIEAFSDGVIAIIITIMVLELKIPHLADGFSEKEVWAALLSLAPKLAAYLLSFVVVAIFWINHHALFALLPHSTSSIVWYNAALLFFMSLIPLPTAFLAEHPALPQAIMFYGLIMWLNAFNFFLLRRHVEVRLKLIPYNKMIQTSNIISFSLYLLSIPLANVSIFISYAIFIGIPIWYFMPDKFHRTKTS